MNTEQTLIERSGGKCELCGAEDNLAVFPVAPTQDETNPDQAILLCADCREQIEDPSKMEINHWRCLNDSMWTPVPAVQVMSWRMLKRLEAESWAQDLLAMLYLDDETLAWAQRGENTSEASEGVNCVDSNGTPLNEGDSVTLIKDLDVKGANFTAKRGTMVKNIHLTDNPEQIEGRVSGVRIVLLTQFLKKA
jgi:protein PhnA